MPLESLDNQINIHDLTLEQEKRPLTEPRIIFESLKDTELYDRGDGYWLDSIIATGGINRKYKMTGSQLLSVAAEAQFDKRKAQNHYEELNDGPLMNKDSGIWYWGININEPDPEGEAQVTDEACELLAQYYLSDPNIKEKFEIFYTKFYKEKNKVWAMAYDKDDQEIIPILHSQLAPILVQSLIDPVIGKKQYDECKKKQYDFEKDKWFDLKKNSNGFNTPREKQYLNSTVYILTDLLIRNSLGDTEARESYKKLKASGFFNADSNKWYSWNSDDSVFMKYYNIDDQFLGILCEKEFEEHEPNLQTPTPPLPETRKY